MGGEHWVEVPVAISGADPPYTLGEGRRGAEPGQGVEAGLLPRLRQFSSLEAGGRGLPQVWIFFAELRFPFLSFHF